VIRHELKPFTEVTLADLFVAVVPIAPNNNSNPESAYDPRLVKTFLPKLVWLDFLHRPQILRWWC
jgi:hypothetical protein